MAEQAESTSFFGTIIIPAHEDAKKTTQAERSRLHDSVKHSFVQPSLANAASYLILHDAAPRAMMMALSAGIRIQAKNNPASHSRFVLPTNACYPAPFARVVAWFKQLCAVKHNAPFPTLVLVPGGFDDSFAMFKTLNFLKIESGAERVAEVLRDYMDTFPLSADEFALVAAGMGQYSPLMVHMLESTVQFWHSGFDESKEEIEAWIGANSPKLRWRMNHIWDAIDPQRTEAKGEALVEKVAGLTISKKENQSRRKRGRRNTGSAKGKKSSPPKTVESIEGNLDAARDGFCALGEDEVDYLFCRK